MSPLYYYSTNSRLYIGYSNHLENNNKMNVRAFSINFSSTSIGSTSIGNLGIEIGNYVKITDKKIIENFLVGNW